MSPSIVEESTKWRKNLLFIICLKIFDFRYTPEKSSKLMFAYNSCKMVLEWRDNVWWKIFKKKMRSRKRTLKERENNLNHDASKCRKITDTFFRKTTVTEWVYFAFVFSLHDIFVCNLISCYSWWPLLNGIQNLGFKTFF